MTTDASPTTPLLSANDIYVLNAARRVLRGLQERTRSRGYADGMSHYDRVEAGQILQVASAAEAGLFDVLNHLHSARLARISDDALFLRGSDEA